MPGIALIRSFLQQASAQGSRSTALNPLGWLVALLMPGVVATSIWSVPVVVTMTLLVMLCAASVLYGGAYIYFMLKDPDALRSEKFTLSKMALERTAVGDDLVGLHDADTLRTVDTLPVGQIESRSEATNG